MIRRAGSPHLVVGGLSGFRSVRGGSRRHPAARPATTGSSSAPVSKNSSSLSQRPEDSRSNAPLRASAGNSKSLRRPGCLMTTPAAPLGLRGTVWTIARHGPLSKAERMRSRWRLRDAQVPRNRCTYIRAPQCLAGHHTGRSLSTSPRMHGRFVPGAHGALQQEFRERRASSMAARHTSGSSRAIRQVLSGGSGAPRSPVSRFATRASAARTACPMRSGDSRPRKRPPARSAAFMPALSGSMARTMRRA